MLALILPEKRTVVEELPGGEVPGAEHGAGRRIDLATGEITAVRWQRQGAALRFPDGLVCVTPTLLHLGG